MTWGSFMTTMCGILNVEIITSLIRKEDEIERKRITVLSNGGTNGGHGGGDFFVYN